MIFVWWVVYYAFGQQMYFKIIVILTYLYISDGP